MSTTIHSLGSKWYGEEADPIETPRSADSPAGTDMSPKPADLVLRGEVR